MGEDKDLGIKLFGKKIVLTENEKVLAVAGQDSGVFELVDSKVNNFIAEDGSEAEKDHVKEETENKLQDKASRPTTDKTKAVSESNETPKTPSINEETENLKPSNAENDQSDTTDSQQKTLKKPDKILPCPRCDSMDTKFCYYNNYNVSQPRHFCKGCQRYWTAGGTMRKMPVGAGRRKNKNSISRCQQMTISETLHAAQIDALSGNEGTALKNNATVLSFGENPQLCKPVTSDLSIAEKKVLTSVQKGFYKHGTPIPCEGGEYGDDSCSGSSIKTSNSVLEATKDGIQVPEARNIHGFPPQIPFHPAFPWPCPWNSAVPMHEISPSGFPFPYFPTPYWNYNVPGYWNLPWLPPPCHVTNQDASVYVSNSSTLGKHSRKGDLLWPINVEENDDCKQNNSKQSVLVPKTLRIDDLDEAAKGSIFSSLGIKNDSMTKAFQPKKDDKSQVIRPSQVLQANPAALSRSLRFQETA